MSVTWGCATPTPKPPTMPAYYPPQARFVPNSPPTNNPIRQASHDSNMSLNSPSNQRYELPSGTRNNSNAERESQQVDRHGPHQPTSNSNYHSPSDQAAVNEPENVPQPGQPYPIDLSTALAMGGANHLQIQMARERVIEAHANLTRARAMWLPSLRFGLGWTRHDGRLQETQGGVLEIDRNSLFVGGGAGLGDAPLAAGSGGPPRFFVNLSLTDAIFERWVAERSLAAESSAESATMNDSLMSIAIAYFSLVEAHGQLANSSVGLKLSSEMVKLTSLFAREGAGSEAAVDLAKTEQATWQQAVQDAQRQTLARSAELTRLIRLDSRLVVVPADTATLPIDLIDPQLPLDQLMSAGVASRPELAQYQAMVDGAYQRTRQEHWRPWLPNVQVGASGGTFGGGPSSTFDNQGSRSDVDLLAVWEVQNLGLGVAASRRATASQLRQAEFKAQWVFDRVMADITTASNDVHSYRSQIESATRSVADAGRSYERNFGRVREGEGLPIELLQAIRARANALDAYTRAVANYNRAQVRLLRAIGRPPEVKAPRETPGFR